MYSSSQAHSPVGSKARQRSRTLGPQDPTYAASGQLNESTSVEQPLHEATWHQEAAQQHPQQHFVPACASLRAAAEIGCPFAQDVNSDDSNAVNMQHSIGLPCSSDDSFSTCSHACVSSCSEIFAESNEVEQAFWINHADVELADFLSSRSLNSFSHHNSAAWLAGELAPAADVAGGNFASSFLEVTDAGHSTAVSAEDWVIGTSIATSEPRLIYSGNNINAVDMGGSWGPAAHAGRAAEDVTDPLMIAAHAVIAAAGAARPPGATTSGADVHTLLSSCGGGAVLLLGHASTTIGTPGGQRLSGASFDHLLQHHQASCSMSSAAEDAQVQQENEQETQKQHRNAAGSRQNDQDEQLQLPPPQQQGSQRGRRMGMVVQQQQVTLQGLQRNRRMGMLVCRAVGSNTTTVQPPGAAATQPHLSNTTAVVPPATGAAEDASCSRSILVLGVTGAAEPESAAVACSNPATPGNAGGSTPCAIPMRQPHHRIPTAQPVMQLLSCSTLLSPCCSSTLLGSGNTSCLRIGSINLSMLNALLGQSAPQHAAAATAAATVPPAGNCACSNAVYASSAGGMTGHSHRLHVLKTALGQHLQQLQEDQKHQAKQKEQQFFYLLD